MKRIASFILAFLAGVSVALWLFPSAEATEENIFDDVEWKKGAYYTTPNTAASRRHCVIPLTVGEKYTFSVPDNKWVINVTLADANGAIYITSATQPEFQIANGDVYTVRPLDSSLGNRTPTEMRITIRPNPDANITDAMMETLNIGLKKTSDTNNLLNSVIWKAGSYTTSTAASRKHCVIPCSLGDVLQFRFPDSKWHLQFQLADGDGTILNRERYLSFDISFTVTEINGRIPTKVIINMVPNPDANISSKMWALMQATLHQTQGSGQSVGLPYTADTFRMATMNVGVWNMGVTPRGVTDDQVAPKSAAWHQLLADVNADILCGQEYYPYFDRSATMFATEAVLGRYCVCYEEPFLYGKVTASNISLSGYSTSSYISSSGRGYTRVYADINGKQVCIINIHTNFGDFETSSRKAEFEELLTLMQKEEYVILCGDFNVDSYEEFQFFTDEGYQTVNCGKFGSLPTCGAMCIDNIIVSPNIEIVSAQVVDSGLSDHRLLYADLRIVPTGIAAVDQEGNQISVSDPLAAWETGNYTYLKLYRDMALDLSGQTVCMDLNGNDLTVSGTGWLKAFDSANDTYDASACGSITNQGLVGIASTVTAPNGNHYIAVTEGTTTFHRYAAPIQAVTLRTEAAGLYYKAVYHCDRLLASRVKTYGVVLSIENMPGSDFLTDAGMNSYTVASKAFESGVVATSGSVFGILKQNRTSEQNARYGEIKIYANPYLQFEMDGLIVVGDPENAGKTVGDTGFSGTAWSFQEVLAQADADYYTYAPAEQTQLDQFYSLWAEKGLGGWEFQRIGQYVDNSDLAFFADSNDAVCPVCKKIVTWTALTDETQPVSLTAGDHYYLQNDLTYTGTAESYLIAGDTSGTVCLHLNGYNITAENSKAVYVTGALNMLGNGIVSGNHTTNYRGATLEVNAMRGQVNLYGGTYTKADANTNSIVNIHGTSGGTINMYTGATIDGSGLPGCCINSWYGKFNMYGGEILGGSSHAVTLQNWTTGKTGAAAIYSGRILGNSVAIMAAGTEASPAVLDICGGSLQGTVKLVTTIGGAKVTISGAPVILQLQVPKGATVTLEQLNPAASIAISASGVFTQALDMPERYLSCVRPFSGYQPISVVDGALYTEKQ